MEVSGIGVQTISPTTGTNAQDRNSSVDRGNDRGDSNANSARVDSSPPPGTGKIVDKRV